MDSRDRVLEGYYFLIKTSSSETLIFWDGLWKRWSKTLPMWVQLKLNLRHWEEKSLHKITSRLGDPIKWDEATRNRDKLQYARILVEVKIDQKFPEFIQFWNENGCLTEVLALFEGKPIQCQSCNGFGHIKR